MNGWHAFLNIFFFVFHTVFTLFNCIGWAIPSLRKWHLITLLLTAFSWFVLGIWYGWGYCVCTDWHYTVRERLGLHDQQGSYIRFLINKLFGVDLNEQLVENATLVVFICCVILSIGLNIRDYQRKKRGGKRITSHFH